MKTCKKKWLSLAIAAALGAGLNATAQAGVIGQSVLEISNFQFLNPNGTTVNANQLDFLDFADSSLASASLNGAAPTAAVLNQTTFGTLDLPQVCQGTCTNPQNDFSHRSPPPTKNVARADTLLNGAPIVNPAGVPTPADAHVVNEAQLTTGSAGNTQANLGLTASFSFSLTNSQTVTISFASNSHLLAAVDPTSSGTARASDQFTIEIRDSAGNLVFSWTPNGGAGGITGGVEIADACDINRAVNAQLPGQTSTFDCIGAAAATTGLLLATETYTLGLRHAGAVDVLQRAAVPEPATLLLLGAGLIGLGVSRRKQLGV